MTYAMLSHLHGVLLKPTVPIHRAFGRLPTDEMQGIAENVGTPGALCA
ncbi:hypothetical protein ABID21_002975 [Pseudorhizobium tarimense]|uniref:Uncharacterized protein n=1 Tax=Pseudorhizobium tarimense TaxID=1079109 RepID=A0ABV2H8I6_9HYPH